MANGKFSDDGTDSCFRLKMKKPVHSAKGFIERIVKHLSIVLALVADGKWALDLRRTLGEVSLEDDRNTSHFSNILNVLAALFTKFEVTHILILVCKLAFR